MTHPEVLSKIENTRNQTKGRQYNCAAIAWCDLLLFQTLFVGNRKFPPALFAAACQYFAAIFRLHALTKTMFVFAGTAGRLECTFHCESEYNEFAFFKIGAQR